MSRSYFFDSKLAGGDWVPKFQRRRMAIRTWNIPFVAQLRQRETMVDQLHGMSALQRHHIHA